MKTKDLTLMGILTALALPGVKLGLANTVTLFALYRLSPAQAALILTARCLLTAAFSGNMTGLAFSMAGGLISLGVMAAARHSRHLSVFGVSVLGAAGHNFGQILTARLLMNSPYIWGYLPYLLLIGTACGLATGAVGAGVLRALGAAGKSLRGA